MEEIDTIPSPVHFNCLKHHAGFIKNQIASVTSTKIFELLRKQLVKIGGSQMDLYLGIHTPVEISKQVLEILNRKKISSFTEYQNWLLMKGKEFRQIQLRDRSIWVLRPGENYERYLHIHPGRYSPNTIRVKAITLKTAILILSIKQLDKIERIDTQVVNDIRRIYLNEPPLKSFLKASGLGRKIQLFSKE